MYVHVHVHVHLYVYVHVHVYVYVYVCMCVCVCEVVVWMCGRYVCTHSPILNLTPKPSILGPNPDAGGQLGAGDLPAPLLC